MTLTTGVLVALIFGYILFAVFFSVLSAYIIEKISYGLDEDLVGVFCGILWPIAMPILITIVIARWIGRKF